MKVKKIIKLFLLLVSCQVIAQYKLVKISDFGNNKGNLEMYIYKPTKVVKQIPLVVVLHGCGQTANKFSIQSGWNTLADSHNFMVIYPQQKVENNFNKCFNWFEVDDISKDGGESNSIREMIQYAIRNFDINVSKIFISGFSAGGAMANVLMANYPNLFNSGAILSGIPFKAAGNLSTGFLAMQGKIKKTKEEWVKLIKDNNLNYKGKYPKVVIFQGIDDPFVSNKNAEIILMQWKGILIPDKISSVIKRFNTNEDVTKTSFFKDKNPIIIKFDINRLGHAIAVDPGNGKFQGGNIGKFSVDKNFYSTYWIINFFGLIK